MKRAALLAIVLVSACADEDDSGSAPTIVSVSLTPDHVAVGGQVMVNGSVPFMDPDGDVENLEIDLATPDGMHSGMEVEVSNVDGVVEGTVLFTVTLMLPAAGSYPISVQLVDTQGNFSNTKSAPLVAE
ncbi:MAG TPA: hypothetical protein VG755_41110 [Nannocystaceae bacterium]|nr:hypothetical protein [Nannocystaceae bacterium]